MTTLFATAAQGTEDLVAKELRGLGFDKARRAPGGATFEAGDHPMEAAMRACLHLRGALRVLWPLASFRAGDAGELYQGLAAVPWEDHLSPRHTFAVSATTRAKPPLAHAPFLAMRTKDAVVDRLRHRRGARPDVDLQRPDMRLYVHIDGRGAVTAGLDASGDSLHRRGYRQAQTDAPLRESLAASVVLATGWDAEVPFCDPMCGSGTLVLEAALLACRVAPGLIGARRFGFQGWPGFGDAARRRWGELLDEARAMVRASPVPLAGSDRDAAAIDAARANAGACPAGVRAAVAWSVADAREVAPLDPPGVLVTNPPYGERLGGSPALEAFWRQLGAHLRTLHGHTAFVLGPSEQLRWLGMRPTWERALRNGPLRVSLCRFELGRQRRRRARG